MLTANAKFLMSNETRQKLPWTMRVDGDDLVIEGGKATAFGGANDPKDDGRTASGVSTRANPGLIGCALPMSGFEHVHSTAASPIPRLPWGTKVIVHDPLGDSGSAILCELIDIGPSLNVDGGSHAIDLTVAAARRFDPKATASNFERRLDYRIVGGAKYLAS